MKQYLKGIEDDWGVNIYLIGILGVEIRGNGKEEILFFKWLRKKNTERRLMTTKKGDEYSKDWKII